MKDIFVEICSDNVVVYKCSNDNLIKLTERFIDFMEGFTAQEGITPMKKVALVEFLQEIKSMFPESLIKVYASSPFRSISKGSRDFLEHEIFERCRVYLNILPEDVEEHLIRKGSMDKTFPNSSASDLIKGILLSRR